MKLEELIYTRITQAPYQEMLATHHGAPAIFLGICPDDADAGWGDVRQYPRISYNLDLRGDPERQTAGTLFCDIWCTQDGPMPEDIEPQLRAILCGVIMAPDNAPPCSFDWRASQTFHSNRKEQHDKVIGVTVSFDMFAFPEQITSDPDPILAAVQFCRHEYPEISVIQTGELQEFTIPTEERPAVYFRMGDFSLAQEAHTVAWMDGVVVAHVFAPTASDRLRWIRAINDELVRRGEITMLDGSPMFLQRITADATLDPLEFGQIRLGVRWGVLKQPAYAHRINHIHTSKEA